MPPELRLCLAALTNGGLWNLGEVQGRFLHQSGDAKCMP